MFIYFSPLSIVWLLLYTNQSIANDIALGQLQNSSEYIVYTADGTKQNAEWESRDLSFCPVLLGVRDRLNTMLTNLRLIPIHATYDELTNRNGHSKEQLKRGPANHLEELEDVGIKQ